MPRKIQKGEGILGAGKWPALLDLNREELLGICKEHIENQKRLRRVQSGGGAQ